MNSVMMEQANLELGLVNTDSLLTLLESPGLVGQLLRAVRQGFFFGVERDAAVKVADRGSARPQSAAPRVPTWGHASD